MVKNKITLVDSIYDIATIKTKRNYIIKNEEQRLTKKIKTLCVVSSKNSVA